MDTPFIVYLSGDKEHLLIGNFIAEISMDETDTAQTPAELLIILAAIADEAIPIQTIAPKFSGRFNKGVDYVGDVPQFAREMALDMAAIQHAVGDYGGLPRPCFGCGGALVEKVERPGPDIERRKPGVHVHRLAKNVIGFSEGDCGVPAHQRDPAR